MRDPGATITLASAPNALNRWTWLVPGNGWSVASGAETFEQAAIQALAEVQRQESIKRPSP